ncbi:hypothetical protein [Sporosarcina highlanderae]|uniref:YceG-like family protein n=1 Tax=Sporosarcina highlanderae TaxID=3035916 RepID=A0ABT8JV33_9BACL|nr:hypothetical protein [Sporosarcina highlanderae]MDN4609039.1 hypothetical protein [Sporosarcina highlanderae]
MMNELLRATGIGCILAGAILYFTNTSAIPSTSQHDETEIQELLAELERVKKELAVAQTATLSESDNQNDLGSAKNEIEEDTEEEQQTTPDPVTKIIISIEPGSNSKSVAAKLERVGVIESARSLETYLIENGLSGLIQIGEYEVDTTMDIKTVAGIITKTN